MRRFLSLIRRVQLCSAREDEVVTDKDLGAFPINRHKMNSQNYSSATFLTDFDELYDDENDEDRYPWAPMVESSSPANSKKSRKQKDSPATNKHHWKKLVDTEEDTPLDLEPTVFTNIQLVKTDLFERNQEEKVKQVEETSPQEEKVADKDLRMKIPKAEYTMDFPVQEIKKHRRQGSDLSDVSSLSGPRHCPLEFSLERGFEGQSPIYQHISEDIVRSLERSEYGQDLPEMNRYSKRCLILLMDPKKKLFEIVAVPYEPNKTTVGEMMRMLKDAATDYRLAKQTYTGLAYQGMHICAPMVPVDVILDAEASGKPLLAVPANFSAGQIEMLGKSLLECPSVARLLEDQLARLVVRRQVETSPATSPDTKSKTKISPRQNYLHEPSKVFSQNSNRLRV